LQAFVTTAISMPFVVVVVLVQTPFGEIHLSLPARAACFVVGALAGELYLDATSHLVPSEK
jgi:hypothetical protein